MIEIRKTIIMQLPSHFIDVINISTNNLLIDYQIEKVDLTFFGKILRLNNWLTFKDWLEVYEKLDSIFEDYELKPATVNKQKENVIDFLKDFQSESFKIANKSIRVSITKTKFDPSLAEIYSAYDCKFHNFMLKVLICMERNLESVEYHPVNKVSDYKYSAHKKLSVTTEEEPYFPQPIKSKDEQLSPNLFLETQSGHESFPVYKPSPISSGRKKNSGKHRKCKQKLFEKTSLQEQRETRSKHKFDMDQNYHEKKFRTNHQGTEIENCVKGKQNFKRTELFGSDSEIESEEKYVYSLKQVEDIDHCKLDITSKFSFKPSKKKKHLSSSNVIDPVINKNKLNKYISEDFCRIKNEIHDIKSINELHDVMECTLKPKKDSELKTLNHLPISYVISTFSKHEKTLNNYFEKFKQSKYRHIPKIEDLDYMAIHNFISEEHLLEMSSFLKKKYESRDGFPQFTDFCMNLLIPEWILSIFMEEHNMNRKDALQQILNEDESNFSTQMIGTTLLNTSK